MADDEPLNKAATASATETPTTEVSSKKTAADATEAKGASQRTLVRQDVHTTYFPDQKVYIRRGVKLYSDNSLVNHGLYTVYYRNGEKLEEGSYVDGVKQGPWQEFHDNGKVARVENYVDGKLDGQWTKYDEKGMKEADVGFKAGKREGRWIYYQPDGKVAKTEEYRDGKSTTKPAGK